MIVDPDFPDHWKTELIIRATGSESSVRCLLRFWAHCQHRRQWKFNQMNPTKLASICKWEGDEKAFWNAMCETFLESDGNGTVEAHEWKLVNKRLLHNWQAGQKGGRPKKKPKGNPRVSQGVTLVSSLSNLSSLSSKEEKEGTGEKRKPSGLDEVIEFAKTIGVSESDATAFFNSKEACGWTRGGKPLKSWQAHLRSWKDYGYLASQKQQKGGAQKPKQTPPWLKFMEK